MKNADLSERGQRGVQQRGQLRGGQIRAYQSGPSTRREDLRQQLQMRLPDLCEVVRPLDLQAQVVDRHDPAPDGFRRLRAGQNAPAESLELLHRTVGGRDIVANVLGELTRDVLIERQHQFFFTREVLVERSQAEIRPVDEGLDREIGLARLLYQFQRGGQEPRTARECTRSGRTQTPLDRALLPRAVQLDVVVDQFQAGFGIGTGGLLRRHNAERLPARRGKCAIYLHVHVDSHCR